MPLSRSALSEKEFSNHYPPAGQKEEPSSPPGFEENALG